MIDRVYRVPIATLGLHACLVISEREHPKESQPDVADLYVHVLAPRTGAPNDDALIARFEEVLTIFEHKKELGLLYTRPSRLTVTRLNLYMRQEHGEQFTLDTLIALFEGLVEHLERTRDPGDGAEDMTGDVEDSQNSGSSESVDSEDSEMPTHKGRSARGK